MIYIEFNDFTRLGNWMFQYATAISLHQKVGVVLASDYAKKKLPTYQEVFKDIQIVDKIPDDVNTIIYDPKTNESISTHDLKGDIYLKGLFQSPKYFDEDLVRETFSPTSNRLNELELKYGDWLHRPNVTGIHVRRGDYLQVLHSNPFVGEQYLLKAIEKLPECNDFIVCSDDISWCKSFFSKQFPCKNFLFVEGTSEVNDLYLLSRCQHNIISNGTFGWWQSWLNPNKSKRIIAPSLWFGYHLKQKGYVWNDFYYEGVEVIENDYTLTLLILAHLQYWNAYFKKYMYPIYSKIFKLIKH